ncbi:MAG: hypothetical protein RR993_04290 [Clostridia bacterium]
MENNEMISSNAVSKTKQIWRAFCANKYALCLVVASIELIVSIVEILSGIAPNDYTSNMLISNEIMTFVWLGVLIYAICTHKKRKWYDYVVVGMAVAMCVATALICFFNIRFGGISPNMLQSDEYFIFPCIIKQVESVFQVDKWVESRYFLFYPNLVVAFVGVVLFVTKFVFENKLSRKATKVNAIAQDENDGTCDAQ